MEIITRTVGKCKVLDCRGELIIGPATEALSKAIHEAVQDGTLKVILNLCNVSYIDSSGYGELIGGHLYTKNLGSKLILLNATKKILRLMELTKTGIIFEYFNDEQKALEGCE
jgi:anti-sigma B factor antagonist